MPPRKRHRAAPKASAATLEDVPLAKQTILELCERTYEKQIKDGDDYGFPLGKSGTFQEIVERAWAEPAELVKFVSPCLKAAGFLDTTAGDEVFMSTFCTMSSSWPPEPGMHTTSIFMWNFSRRSFWKDFLPMSEVRKIARSICLTRFRLVRRGPNISPKPPPGQSRILERCSENRSPKLVLDNRVGQPPGGQPTFGSNWPLGGLVAQALFWRGVLRTGRQNSGGPEGARWL